MALSNSDYPTHFEPYVTLAQGDDPRIMLLQSLPILEQFLKSLNESAANHAYALGKWTVKQVLQHCIDAERIFAYRALCHARGEQQILPGFNENEYAATANVNHRTLKELVDESLLARMASISLFGSFTNEDLNRTGQLKAGTITTQSWAYIIVGHWMHHQNILKERYGI